MKTDWVGRSSILPVAPYISRMVYWDKVQNQEDTRYWSYCLERRMSDIETQDETEVPRDLRDSAGGLLQERDNSQLRLERQAEGSELTPSVHNRQGIRTPGQDAGGDRGEERQDHGGS